MRPLDPEQIRTLAQTMRQLDSEQNRPRTITAYWAEVGRRLALTFGAARQRAERFGLRPYGLVRAKSKGAPCVFSEKFKR